MGTPRGGRRKGAVRKAPKKPGQPKTTQVAFQWRAPDATTVTLAGDFNGWDPHALPLKQGKDGVWKAALRLAPGRYEYLFVVDGAWREDPLNPNRVPNPHGGFNSVCQVG